MEYNKIAYYYNLPLNWGRLSQDNFVISEDRFKKLKGAVYKYVEQSDILYISNIASLIVKDLIEKGVKVYGIDFSKYFDDATSTKEFVLPIDKDIYILYNIGIEKAINTTFSTQLIKNIINEVENLGKTIILTSSLSSNEFYKKYNIEISKSISVSIKKSKEGLI